jgi:hypothetical protein
MRISPPLIVSGLCITLSLSACSTHTSSNPLTDSRYGDELADTLANLIIQSDPITKDPKMLQTINDNIAKAKDMGNSARDQMAEGMQGAIIALHQDVAGYILTLDGILYISSEFMTDPGLDLHVYLTETVDPRDGIFPDPTAIDLGALKTPYGAQSYRITSKKSPELLRTFVLYDKTLKRLYGFAQLSK